MRRLIEAKTCRPTVLIIDDASVIRRLVHDFMVGRGWQTESAEDGDSAMDKLRGSKPYDLAFVDINIPGPNGVDVMRRIRAEKIPTQIVLMTGMTDNSLVMEAVNLGLVGYLRKPDDVNIRSMSEILDNFESARPDVSRKLVHDRKVNVMALL